jgi:hypothetical protein
MLSAQARLNQNKTAKPGNFLFRITAIIDWGWIKALF